MSADQRDQVSRLGPHVHIAEFTASGDTVEDVRVDAQRIAERLAGVSWKIHSLSFRTMEPVDSEVIRSEATIMRTVISGWRCEITASFVPSGD